MDSSRPKRSYRIGELSRLFGIGVDSLRYYEREGLLAPTREANGYRSYALDDLYKLSVIRDLVGLGFSVKQIKEYLDGQSVEKTRALIGRELAAIDAQIERLRDSRDTLVRQLNTLNGIEDSPWGAIAVERRGERRCVELAARLEQDAEMDLVIKRLQRRHEQALPHLANAQIGAVLALDDIRTGATNVYDAVFFVVDDPTGPCDLVLPAGDYLTCHYRGAYEQNGPLVRQMLTYAEAHGLAPQPLALELYLVDNRTTADEDEYASVLEIPLVES